MSKDLKQYAVRILHNASNVIEEIYSKLSENDSEEINAFCFYNNSRLKEALMEIKEAEHFLKHEVP